MASEPWDGTAYPGRAQPNPFCSTLGKIGALEESQSLEKFFLCHISHATSLFESSFVPVPYSHAEAGHREHEDCP